MLVATDTGLVDAGAGRTVAFPARDVRAMGGGWVVLDGHEVRHRDGTPAAVVGPEVRCVAGLPGRPPLVGTAEAHLYRIGDEAELVESFDEAEGRDEWYTPWGGPPDVRSLAVAADGTVLANVHVGGILRSEGDDGPWRATIDLHHDVHQVLAPQDDGMALAACASGLATSGDGGMSWELHDEGLHATYARSVALAGGTVLLGVSTGPGGAQAAVYRRPRAGDRPYERCRAGLPEWLEGNIDTFCLTGGPGGTAAFATAGGDLYLSSDEGATWERAAAGLGRVRAVALA